VASPRQGAPRTRRVAGFCSCTDVAEIGSPHALAARSLRLPGQRERSRWASTGRGTVEEAHARGPRKVRDTSVEGGGWRRASRKAGIRADATAVEAGRVLEHTDRRPPDPERAFVAGAGGDHPIGAPYKPESAVARLRAPCCPGARAVSESASANSRRQLAASARAHFARWRSKSRASRRPRRREAAARRSSPVKEVPTFHAAGGAQRAPGEARRVGAARATESMRIGLRGVEPEDPNAKSTTH